jgi:hypothetical protein
MWVYIKLFQHGAQQPFADVAMLHRRSALTDIERGMAALAVLGIERKRQVLLVRPFASASDEFLAVHVSKLGQNCPMSSGAGHFCPIEDV